MFVFYRLLDSKEPDEEQKSKVAALKSVRISRKRGATPDSRKQDADQSEDNSETSTNPDEDMNPYEELFTAVMTASDTDNNTRTLHSAFQLLPSKKKYPEYYNVIDNPIDLKMIASKIQKCEYSSLGEMEKDLLLMTRNACLFNEPGSKIYKDSKTLKKVSVALLNC